MRANAHKPWLGLAAYEESDRPFFHGRSAESAALCALVEREPLSVLYGISGLGKTSLVHAGLFPKLRLEDNLPIYLRLRHEAPESGEAPIGGTLAEQVLDAVSPGAEFQHSGRWYCGERPTLWEWFHHRDLRFWSEKNRLLVPILVFDQFEEVFTLGQQTPERAARTAIFLEEVSALIYNRPPASVEAALARDEEVPFEFENVPLRVLLSLREDFLPHLAGLRERGFPTIRRNEMRLLPMEAVAAREVIEVPGRDLLEEGVSDEILAFVLGEEGSAVDPALLSLVLRELNEKRETAGLPRITASLLSGSKNEILSEFYESAFEALNPAVRTFVESELVSPGGFRDSRALDYALARPGVTQAALDTLVDRRLLRLEDRAAGARRVELTHDLLCGVATAARVARLAARQRRKVRRARILVAVLGIVAVGLGIGVFQSQQKAREAEVDLTHAQEHLAHAQEHLARVDKAARLDRERMRANLVRTIQQRSQEEIGRLDPALDWKRIAEVVKLRDQQLADVDRLVEQVDEAFKRNEVSANYSEAGRILTEKGPSEALRFLAEKAPARDKELEVLALAKARAEETHRNLLREKLLNARLLEKAGQWDVAEAEYRAVVRDGGMWPEPRNEFATLLQQRGDADPEAGKVKLQDAVDLCRGTLATTSRDADPQAWSTAQRTLADALVSEARRAAFAESQRLLRDAVAAYRSALEVYTRAQWPQAWATTQNSLGNALQDQGTRANGTEGQPLLEEAEAAYRAALEVRTREQLPQAWAQTQNNLGLVLGNQGTLANRTEGRRLLAKAVAAFQAALDVYQRDKWPQDWAITQNNLGAALMERGLRTGDDEGRGLFSQAEAAFRAVLEVFKRDRVPQDWAMTQYNLGVALMNQGTMGDVDAGLPQLGEAVTAFQLALEVYQRDQLPQEWARAQNNLGLALLKRGTRLQGAAGGQLLGEAITAFQAALEVYQRDQLPQDWARAQYNLGLALWEQGTRTEGNEGRRLIDEAVTSFRAALEVYQREQSPIDWKLAQENLADTLRALSTRSKGLEAAQLLSEAKRIEKELAAP
ncbi:MAG TPA: hypothetical protein VGO11_13465 [Chthoniobacteraceae bacterium]|jgi:tetratricopeptide (TPR) repeat protein|nr:hypothetical protein [Chthoniobacteraceae bacterium]